MNANPPPTAAALLVVIGPSGSGKSTAVRRLVDRGRLRVHPTWTTRPRRPDERTGSTEHRFVDDDRFDALRDRCFFLDTVELFGLPHRYGLPPIRRSTDGRVDTVMLRAPLVDRFRAVVPEPTVVVQIECADDEQILERLRRRATTAEDRRARLADNRAESALGRTVADVVLANDGTIEQLTDALDAVALALAAGEPSTETAA
jgi:guanylate kinase